MSNIIEIKLEKTQFLNTLYSNLNLDLKSCFKKDQHIKLYLKLKKDLNQNESILSQFIFTSLKGERMQLFKKNYDCMCVTNQTDGHQLILDTIETCHNQVFRPISVHPICIKKFNSDFEERYLFKIYFLF